MTKELLLEMKLHEIKNISQWVNVMRVFGGWIYSFNYPPELGTDYGVFVPEELNANVKTTLTLAGEEG